MPSADQVEAKLQEIAEQLVAANTDSSAAPHLVQPAMGEVQGMKVSVYEFIIIVDCCIMTFISAALSLQFSDFLIDKCIFVYSLLSLYSLRVSLCAAPSCLCIQVQGTKIASYRPLPIGDCFIFFLSSQVKK